MKKAFFIALMLIPILAAAQATISFAPKSDSDYVDSSDRGGCRRLYAGDTFGWSTVSKSSGTLRSSATLVVPANMSVEVCIQISPKKDE